MRIFTLYHVLLVLLLFNCAFAKTLNFLDQNPQYKEYIKYARLYNYMDDESILKYIKRKLKKYEDLRIRVFGDSHVAGDFMTYEFRNILGNVNAVGFLYPLMPPYHQTLLIEHKSVNFAVFDSRKPKLYDDYPMGGVVAYPSELPAHIQLSINPKQVITWDNNFITQIIFKNSDTSDALMIEDSNNKQYKLKAQRPNSWDIAKLELKFPITINALSQDVKLGGYFIYNDKNNNIIEHLGINGVRSDIWLKWNLDILEEELKLIKYDIIILCYGSNDAMYDILNEDRFVANYTNFINILKKNNPDSIIILMSPPPVMLLSGGQKQQYKESQIFVPIKEAIKKIAQTEKIMFFDTDDFIVRTGTKKNWSKLNLSKKDVHLTPQGYRLVAHGIYEALKQELKQY